MRESDGPRQVRIMYSVGGYDGGADGVFFFVLLSFHPSQSPFSVVVHRVSQSPFSVAAHRVPSLFLHGL